MNCRKKRAAGNLSSSSCEVMESEWRGPCEIQVLPPDIIIDILSRLPIKAILYCKCVCKDWLRLISHPRFVELQVARSSTAMLIRTLRDDENYCRISLIQVEQRGRAPFSLDKLMLTPKSNLPCARFIIVNSCNGLLCLFGCGEPNPIWVCNPILGEYVAIPTSSKGREWACFTGLGFCSVANRYKLLHTFYPKDDRSEDEYLDAEIYDMDTGTWRSIGHAPFAQVHVELPFNSLLRGSLHWARTIGDDGQYIYSFNFETEEFGTVPPPPCLDHDENQRKFYNRCPLSFGVVEGCLFLCLLGEDTWKFDIWVMKDYGVKDSWTKQFVIENLYPQTYGPAVYEPMIFLNNGEILMFYGHSEVVCYDLQTRTFRATSITCIHGDFDPVAHTPSLVSLHHVAKGELVKRVQGSTKRMSKVVC